MATKTYFKTSFFSLKAENTRAINATLPIKFGQNMEVFWNKKKRKSNIKWRIIQKDGMKKAAQTFRKTHFDFTKIPATAKTTGKKPLPKSMPQGRHSFCTPNVVDFYSLLSTALLVCMEKERRLFAWPFICGQKRGLF